MRRVRVKRAAGVAVLLYGVVVIAPLYLIKGVHTRCTSVVAAAAGTQCTLGYECVVLNRSDCTDMVRL